MTFAIKGNTELPKKDLKHKIERLGGSVVETMDKTTTACVSTKGKSHLSWMYSSLHTVHKVYKH